MTNPGFVPADDPRACTPHALREGLLKLEADRIAALPKKVTMNRADAEALMTYAMGHIEWRHEIVGVGVQTSERNLFRRVSRATGIPTPKFDPTPVR